MVRAEAIFFPALTAEFVILLSAVIPATCSAENLAFTVSTPLVRADASNLLAVALTFSNPLEAPSKFKLFFNRSSVDMLV